MQVTVYGASGKVGRLVVDELLVGGHTVVAFVHNYNPFVSLGEVQVVSGSVDNPTLVAAAAAGSQVIISTLGSWGTPSKAVVSTGTGAIIAAAAKHKITRVITLTGASALYVRDKPTLRDRLIHVLLNLAAAKILRDGEAHLRLLADSSLDWTSIRSPIMLGFGSTLYGLQRRLPSLLATIPRRAVVKALVDQLNDTSHLRQAPVIRRG